MILLIDDVLSADTLSQLIREAEQSLVQPQLVRYENPYERKYALDRIHYRSEILSAAHNRLDEIATKILRRMFKEQTVVSDRNGRGCGLHVLPTNGYLGLHYDGNWHPSLQMLRFANMVFYVAGGPSDFHYEDLRIPFKPNRMVLFTTTRNEVHGIPNPVNVPRYTLSTFYYVIGPKPERTHRAVFVEAPKSFTDQRSAL